MPHLPLIYRNRYREQIGMNAELIELNRQKKLEGEAAYIFMETKPREELYDLESDPYEVHNLAKDPKYLEKMTTFRKTLASWQLEVGDKGFIPERLQPVTSNVNFDKIEKGHIKLNCETEGASIGYQIGNQIGSSSWNLYHTPIKANENEKIVARAIRIGFKASQITSN